MRRLSLVFIVGLLAFSVSGISSLVVAEPCFGYEQQSDEDDACPPMCVTCGCCAQAVEPVGLAMSAAPDARISAVPDGRPSVPRIAPRDVLHVPKFPLA